MTNMTDEHYCTRCGKRTGAGIHTCTPNPVIARLAASQAKLDAAVKAMTQCYQMLLSEPDTKGALFKAENILREALAEIEAIK